MNSNCLHFCIEELFMKAPPKTLPQFYEPPSLMREPEAVARLCELLRPLDTIACDLQTDYPALNDYVAADPLATLAEGVRTGVHVCPCRCAVVGTCSGSGGVASRKVGWLVERGSCGCSVVPRATFPYWVFWSRIAAAQRSMGSINRRRMEPATCIRRCSMLSFAV